MTERSLLVPGSSLVEGYGEDALLGALLKVELAWVAVQHQHGLTSAEVLRAVSAACQESWQPRELDHGVALGGNPVIPMLEQLRTRAAQYLPAEGALNAIHRGLTSQDVLDSALMLLVRDATETIALDLDEARAAAKTLMIRHRETPILARTLARAAGRSNFGAKIAVWYQTLSAAAEQLNTLRSELPISFGGAAGDLAAARDYAQADSTLTFSLVDDWGAKLGLHSTAVPWHVSRFPLLRAGAALAEVSAGFGKVANDVVQLGRDGIAELREPVAPGRGGSSAMAHKQNPVLSIMIRRAALAAPQQTAQLALGAALAVDERSDVGWHLEWEPLSQLLRDTSIAAKVGAELLTGLRVDTDRMQKNIQQFEAETGVRTSGDASESLINRVLERYPLTSEGASDDRD